MLDSRQVRKSYGAVVALDGVDISVREGTILGLLGPNGAGKTTFVSIVAGLRRADSGTVQVGGVDVARHPERARRLMGLAPQELGVYPTLTARQNLRFFGELAGLGRRGLEGRIDDVLGGLRLEDKADTVAAQLSGGQKRRLHTAMALLHEPALLLLDEPTAGADVTTRADLLELVRRRAAAGAAVVYSTHYLPEIEQLGAEVAILDGGRLAVAGSYRELVARFGRSVVELSFQGPPPFSAEDFPEADLEVAGRVARLSTHQPEKLAALALDLLRGRPETLQGMEIIRPSLEAVYLAVLGRRYNSDGEDHPADRTEVGSA